MSITHYETGLYFPPSAPFRVFCLLCFADIDECAIGTHNCSLSQTCYNIQGDHRCLSFDCPDNYRHVTDTYVCHRAKTAHTPTHWVLSLVTMQTLPVTAAVPLPCLREKTASFHSYCRFCRASTFYSSFFPNECQDSNMNVIGIWRFEDIMQSADIMKRWDCG